MSLLDFSLHLALILLFTMLSGVIFHRLVKLTHLVRTVDMAYVIAAGGVLQALAGGIILVLLDMAK